MAEKNVVRPSQARRVRPLRLLALLFLGLLFLAAFPPTFRVAVRVFLKFEALRHGLNVEVDRITGSFFQPLWFDNVRIASVPGTGTAAHLKVRRARGTFSLRNLLLRRDAEIWQELRVEGLTGEIDLHVGKNTNRSAKAEGSHAKAVRIPFPATIEVHDASLTVRQNDDFVSLDHVDFRVGESETSEVRIGALTVAQPWLKTKFSTLHGTIALQDGRVVLAAVEIDQNLFLQTAAADLPELLQGRLKMDFAFAAFNGAIRGELRSASRDQHLNFEGSGTFANISIAQLGVFLNEDAGGVIKEGKFTFRGSPRNWQKATVSTRFEAGDFRWAKRRWNSLVLGATLVNHRLMVPEFQLQQAHNSLVLNGEIEFPGDWRTWWQEDFNFKIDARIGSLAELSALLGPDFAEVAGQLDITGEVAGKRRNFTGQLAVAGSHLSYRTAPLDKLNAALELKGNEVRVTNMEFVHGTDFLRGRGVVNILGEKRYWGEVNTAVANLALYSSFMPPPLAPQAFAGALALEWSGDGVSGAHSGAFTAQCRKFRALDEADAHPLDLDAIGTYSPESIFCSKFVLADGATNLSARLIASPRSLTLQGMRLARDNNGMLEGEAQLPLDIWAAWQPPSAAMWWDFTSPCKIDVTAQNLSLHEALLLTGRERPFRGEVTGKLAVEGTLGALAMNGQLQIQKLSTPQLREADGELLFEEHDITVKKAHVLADEHEYTADGKIFVTDVRAPRFALKLKVHPFSLANDGDLRVQIAPELTLDGSPETMRVGGEVRVTSVALDRRIDFDSLLAQGGNGLDGTLSPLDFSEHLPAKWSLDFQVTGSAPIKLANGSGTIEPRLHVMGLPAAPRFQGPLELAQINASSGKTRLTIESGSIFFDADQPEDFRLALRVKGAAGGTDFAGEILGSRRAKKFAWEKTPAFNRVDPGLPLRDISFGLEQDDSTPALLRRPSAGESQFLVWPEQPAPTP